MTKQEMNISVLPTSHHNNPHRGAEQAKARIAQWKKLGLRLIFLLSGSLLIIIVALSAWILNVPIQSYVFISCYIGAWVLFFVSLFVFPMILFAYTERLTQAWFLRYGIEVLATIAAETHVESQASEQGSYRMIQLAWSDPIQEETLSSWVRYPFEEIPATWYQKHPLEGRVWLCYDPADLSSHVIHWTRPVLF